MSINISEILFDMEQYSVPPKVAAELASELIETGIDCLCARFAEYVGQARLQEPQLAVMLSALVALSNTDPCLTKPENEKRSVRS